MRIGRITGTMGQIRGAAYMTSVFCSMLTCVTHAEHAHPRQASLINRKLGGNASYDFVIAGAGIAGLTLADRLTENPDSTS